MTWNIHGAFGRNPRFDLDRVCELILRADPDVIALQEIDSRRDKERNPFTLLQELLGEHGVGAASIVTEDGEYGQLLISRWPLPKYLSAIFRTANANRDARSERASKRRSGICT